MWQGGSTPLLSILTIDLKSLFAVWDTLNTSHYFFLSLSTICIKQFLVLTCFFQLVPVGGNQTLQFSPLLTAALVSIFPPWGDVTGTAPARPVRARDISMYRPETVQPDPVESVFFFFLLRFLRLHKMEWRLKEERFITRESILWFGSFDLNFFSGNELLCAVAVYHLFPIFHIVFYSAWNSASL